MDKKFTSKTGGLARERELAAILEEINTRTPITDLTSDELQSAIDASANKIPTRPQKRYGQLPTRPVDFDPDDGGGMKFMKFIVPLA